MLVLKDFDKTFISQIVRVAKRHPICNGCGATVLPKSLYVDIRAKNENKEIIRWAMHLQCWMLFSHAAVTPEAYAHGAIFPQSVFAIADCLDYLKSGVTGAPAADFLNKKRGMYPHAVCSLEKSMQIDRYRDELQEWRSRRNHMIMSANRG